MERIKDNIITRKNYFLGNDILFTDKKYPEIEFDSEVYFDVDKVFHLHINNAEDKWCNVYATYNLQSRNVYLTVIIDTDNCNDPDCGFTLYYQPSKNDQEILWEMAEDKIAAIEGISLKKFYLKEVKEIVSKNMYKKILKEITA